MITLILSTMNFHISIVCHIYLWYNIIYHPLWTIYLIHPSNKRFHMFTCSSCILSRVIWKMWVKVHLHNFLIAYIILIFIMILTRNAFYGEIPVESKCLWLNFYVILFLQWFRIIMLCHNNISVRKNACLLNYLHSCFPTKNINILWYAYLFNIVW